MKGNVKKKKKKKINKKYDKRDKSNIINTGQQTGQCFKMRKGLKFLLRIYVNKRKQG